LVGTLLILTIDSPANEADFGDAETGAATAVVSSPSTAVSMGQGLLQQGSEDATTSSGDEEPAKPEEPPAEQGPAQPMSWERFILRTDEALEQLDRELHDVPPTSNGPEAEKESGSSMNDGPSGLRSSLDRVPDDQVQERSSETGSDRPAQAIDTALDSLCGMLGATNHIFNHMNLNTVGRTQTTPEEQVEISTSLALATISAGLVYAGSADWRIKSRRRWVIADR
jgi:hypothetical protein